MTSGPTAATRLGRDLGLLLLTAAAVVLAWTGVEGTLRIVIAALAILLVPGGAVYATRPVGAGAAGFGFAIATSLAVVTCGAAAMALGRFWHPWWFLVALAVLAVVLVLRDLAKVWRQFGATTHEAVERFNVGAPVEL